MNYFEAILFDGEHITLTPSEAGGLERAMSADRKYVKIAGTMLAVSSVSRVQETNRKYDQTPAIEGATSKRQHIEGKFENSVQSIYVKKRISRKEWEREYQQLPGYRFLTEDGSDVWLGFSKVRTGQALPEHLIACTPSESDRLAWLFGYEAERGLR